MTTFSRVLVANRGEIACRVLKAARGLGYATVAVYSEADAKAPHVALADQAVCIGPAKASESYLRAEALLEAAARTGADALHPGYGFLSENAEFAAACERAGIVFIGPPAEAIRLMGDKAVAKARMREAGVPTVPGFWGNAERLEAEAERIGYPLLVKATAGGGGRGIRVVRGTHELQEALASARAEAQSAFGNPDVMLERFVEFGRHVEVQVFADAHGHVIHLGERDCTAQRRRQKVIEEAPSPIVSPALRERMGAAAVAAARAVDYRGAGTVEFIVDAAGEPYFLEMNTRLQVEHPVTELVTGLDLVDMQLRVAAGEPLAIAQADVRTRGHAIEARLYAEDPYAEFSPQTGEVLRFDVEAARRQPGVRIDAGIETGSVVTPFYDAMVAKVIAHGDTRLEAIRRLRGALAEATLFGLCTNAHFLCDLLGSEEFGAASMHTGMLDLWAAEPRTMLLRPEPPLELWALAFALCAGVSPRAPLRSASVRAFELTLLCGEQKRSARVERTDAELSLELAGESHSVAIEALCEREVRYRYRGARHTRRLLRAGQVLHLAHEGGVFVFSEPSAFRASSVRVDPSKVLAPTAGTLARVLVQVAQRVERGEVLLIVEAMKMEVKVLAGCSGSVGALHRVPGDQVAANELLLELVPDPANEPPSEA
jgi:geranyl-CoA carboxylase alpha subunit